MATKVRSKPFDRFGRYILFKKLDSHPLGEMWRAGTIEDDGLGPVVALHRLSGGDRGALRAAAESAAPVIPQITGGTVVKNQTVSIIDDVPTLVHEYAGGRTLRHIIERARPSASAHGQPIATDQALAIVEKIAASVEALNNVKAGGVRLNHGALIPALVWVTDDGDVRMAGQGLGRGVIESLKKGGDAARELSPYVAPEIRDSGEPTRASDIYALGALLYLCLTSQEPPDPAAGSIDGALANAMLAHDNEPIPPEIQTVLHKSLVLNPAERYASAADFHQALSQLLHGGKYAPTTFNLAFYLHTLLRKEMEGEAIEREKESKVSIAPYLAELSPAIASTPDADVVASAPTQVFATPTFGAQPGEATASKMPLIAAVLVLLLIGGGTVAYMMSRKGPAAPATRQTAAPVAAAVPKPAPAEPPPVAPVVSATPATTATPAGDADARKKAIEEEVNRRLQTEVQKLQADYNKKLEQTAPPAATAPATTTVARVTRSEPSPPSASQLDESKRPQPARTETVAAAVPPPSQPAPAPASAPPVSTAAVIPQTREGDLVNSSDVDQPPRVLRQVKPQYPPVAERQKAEDVVIVSALVSETGKVLDVKVLRSESRPLGFNEAALRAIRSFTFSPAVKDGKRVRTWFPVPFKFSLH